MTFMVNQPMGLNDIKDEFEGSERQSVGRSATEVDSAVVDTIKAEFGASTNKEAGYLLDYAFHDSMGNEEESEEALEKFREVRDEE